ncbi:DUF2231 domain-containing protein [Phycicoccus duodecadis]|uniref:DUF2231 domain-containing protein n=1 Tax=Phycicoccus duodecadis TaxID=173053 RepID=A0A2N3YLP4_9MICO|nr:DUF2231 domain-containing protein [Phycicoccus duodecadis]PKW27764.1 hypothetical protein ATL31_2615 [Phycicoccus duodecadis]
MFDTVFGIPVHALVVHAVVVLSPLTVLMLLAFSVSERFRAWSGWLTTAVGALTTLFSFVASSSGESLQRRVGRTDLVREHAELGDLLPWVVLGATIVAGVLWYLWRSGRRAAVDGEGPARPSSLFRILTVVGVLAAVGLAVDVTLVGHSGAKAVWSEVGSKTVQGGGGDDEG